MWYSGRRINWIFLTAIHENSQKTKSYFFLTFLLSSAILPWLIGKMQYIKSFGIYNDTTFLSSCLNPITTQIPSTLGIRIDGIKYIRMWLNVWNICHYDSQSDKSILWFILITHADILIPQTPTRFSVYSVELLAALNIELRLKKNNNKKKRKHDEVMSSIMK